MQSRDLLLWKIKHSKRSAHKLLPVAMDNLKLILEVEQNKLLYDPSETHYKDNLKKKRSVEQHFTNTWLFR